MRNPICGFQLIAALVLYFGSALAAAPRAVEPPLPNIVVFLVDDMGVMDSSVPFLTDQAGNPKRYPLNDFYRTPNLEKLADRGVRFSQFCAMSVCSPSRISIMTGKNAARHRTTNWIDPARDNRGTNGPPQWNWQGLKRADTTLAKLLQARGYRTIHVGKGHFGPRHSEGADPLNLGFDINVGGASIGQPGSYYARDHFGAKAGSKAHAVPHLEKHHGTELFLTEALTIEAKARVGDAVKEQRPFFLWFAHYAVHAPFQPDPRFAANYSKSGKSAAAQAYATLIEGMDKSLGDLMDHLNRLGIAENTLILFLGDNGGDAPLGEAHVVGSAAPLRGKKGSHYEGGVRAPLVAAWCRPNAEHPSQRKLPVAVGVVQTQLASVQDLFPTILQLSGTALPVDSVVDGRTMDKLLRGERDPARSDAFLMHYPHGPHRSDYWTSWRDGRWKVIYHYFPSLVSGHSHYQLFDLATDPFEQADLASWEPSELKRMMLGLTAALESHEALYPIGHAQGEPVRPRIP